MDKTLTEVNALTRIYDLLLWMIPQLEKFLKRRVISAAPYFDRVIHHALINIIEPIIGKSFTHDIYTCIKGKGSMHYIESSSAPVSAVPRLSNEL